MYTCMDPESFARGGPTQMFFVCLFVFLVNKDTEDPNNTKSGPSSAHQLKRHLNGVLQANDGLKLKLAWLLLSFVIFQGIRT